MKYNIIKRINASTLFAETENKIYVLKEIPLEDTNMYKKLIKLNCKNVVNFIETTSIDDKFYIVEEYINGITLNNYLENNTLDDEKIREIIIQVCNGLREVHRLGIVHRDINPNNIMITENGNTKIIDFGISRTIKSNKSRDTQILGTQGFTAPEQFGFHQTSERSDIYSIGVLMNYLKTKQIPSEELADGWMREIIIKCTQIDETNRYNNIDDLISAINKKSRVNRIIRLIPGFRKRIWWHSLIASVYYIVMLFFLIMSFVISTSAVEGIANFFIFFFALTVPVPILTNFLNWKNRLPFIANKSKETKIIFQILLCLISIIISLTIIILCPIA